MLFYPNYCLVLFHRKRHIIVVLVECSILQGLAFKRVSRIIIQVDVIVSRNLQMMC